MKVAKKKCNKRQKRKSIHKKERVHPVKHIGPDFEPPIGPRRPRYSKR